MKLSETNRIVGQPLGEKLQRDSLAEPEIVGAIDFTHAAPAEQPDDAVAAVEHRPWSEAPVAD
jgi:hypothetical protein